MNNLEIFDKAVCVFDRYRNDRYCGHIIGRFFDGFGTAWFTVEVSPEDVRVAMPTWIESIEE